MQQDPRDGSFRTDPVRPGDRLDRALRAFRPALSWSALRDLIARGKVTIDGAVVTDDGARVRPGAEVAIRTAARVATAAPTPPMFPRADIVHCDGDVVVVRKPAGLDTVPYGDADDALEQRLSRTLGTKVRVVHRLDRDTTGLLMFARNPVAEGKLAHQLRTHSVQRRYLALAHGEVQPGTVTSFLADDRGDGLRGSVASSRFGKQAITHLEVVERLRGATLVGCRLETGRTHQIRIHLAERGHMLLGERGYRREHQGAEIAAPRIMLHAAELGFVHPSRGAGLHFVEPLPDDMQALLAALR